MERVWIVNMGIGENVEHSKAMRVFKTKKEAVEWVKEHFIQQIQELENHSFGNNQIGLGIGNSFHIYSMPIGG